MKTKLIFLPLVIFLGLIIAFLIQLKNNAQGDDPKALESALIGKTVPAFQLPSLLDPQKTVDDSVLKAGKPRLLNVWATWCPTCMAEHYYLTELAKQGIEIVGVNYKDDQEKALKFLSNNKNPYISVIFDRRGSLGLDLGVYGAPETFIVDGNGIIHYRYAGDVNENVWQTILKPIYEKLK